MIDKLAVYSQENPLLLSTSHLLDLILIMVILFMTMLIMILFTKWLKQFNAALAITGAIKETSWLKIYKKLCLKSLKSRRWSRDLCFFYKLRPKQTPKYLYNFIPLGNGIYNTYNLDQVETLL